MAPPSPLLALVALAAVTLVQGAPYAARFNGCRYTNTGAVEVPNLAGPFKANRQPWTTCFAQCKFAFVDKAAGFGKCSTFVYDSMADTCTFYTRDPGELTSKPATTIMYNQLCMSLKYKAPTATCAFPDLDAPYQADLYTRKNSVAGCKRICTADPFCFTFSYNKVQSKCHFKGRKPSSLVFVPKVGVTMYDITCGSSVPRISQLPAQSAYPVSPFRTVPPSSTWGAYNFERLLGMNFEFYEALWAGPLPKDYRIDWRRPGYTAVCEGRDGGSYEAGNHIQSMLAMAQAAQFQATSILYNRQVYQETKSDGRPMVHWASRELRRAALWLAGAYENENDVLIAIGASFDVFEFFGRAETAPKPVCQQATADQPASDHVAQGANALALASIVFQKTEPLFSARLLDIAEKYFTISQKSNVTAVASGFNIGRLYPSYEPLDPSKHQFLAACSLYQATGEARYWKETQTYQQLSQNRQGWPVLNFDNPYWQGLLCVARSSPEPRERSTARDTIYARMLQRWIDDDSRYLFRTPGGFPYWNTNATATTNWGMLRDTMGTAYMAVMYADLPGAPAAKAQASRCFARNVVEYILGNNKLSRSYVVGYTSSVAKVFPVQVHSRDAACPVGQTCSRFSFRFSPRDNVYEFTGGLVSGPDFNDDFIDRRDEYVYTEIALDFNAAFSATIAALANLPAAFWASDCPAMEGGPAVEVKAPSPAPPPRAPTVSPRKPPAVLATKPPTAPPSKPPSRAAATPPAKPPTPAPAPTKAPATTPPPKSPPSSPARANRQSREAAAAAAA